jgi:predicted nucleic acid-binding protein
VRGWLLDTNVISELRKPNCDARVKAWADGQEPSTLFLSRVTIAEIRYGIERLPAVHRSQKRLEAWLADELRPWFADRVLDVDEEVQGEAIRHTFLQPDLLIAATAILHDLCVVTRNIDDFVPTGVALLNPWTDSVPRPVE